MANSTDTSLLLSSQAINISIKPDYGINILLLVKVV